MIMRSLLFVAALSSVTFCFSFHVEGKLVDDPLNTATKVSAAGMQAQNHRLKVIAQNIANANVTGKTPNEDPYRRQIIFFKNEFDTKLNAKILKVASVREDKSPFTLKYEPSHPSADKNGMVKYPNVNLIIETVDSKEAKRTFDANVHALEIAKTNQNRILDLMR